MARIVISEFIDESALAVLQAAHDVDFAPDLAREPEELARRVITADALIVRNVTQVRGDVLAAATNLRVVGRLGVGLDNIDLEACAARGIEVIPATGANAASVAEWVLASAMILLRGGAYAATASVLAGEWPRARLIGHEIAGRTIGLVGFGSIARQTARRAQGLELKVIAHDPVLPGDDPVWAATNVRPVGFEALLAEADIVSLHAPLLESTRNLIDAAALAAMKPDAILLNSARGGLVDEVALAAALLDGGIAGAALDVYAEEPFPASSHLVDVPNLLLTPHIAGVTVEANARVSMMIARAVADFLGDAPS